MEFTGLGGGIMVVLAAGLWLVYLMPTWFKRREYVSVERNEVRRQQALRVLQETAPVPMVKRVEQMVSPTGEVTDPAKLAEAIKRSKDAQAARLVSQQYGNPLSPAARALGNRRLRRTRAMASILLLAALATIVVQVVIMVTSGIALGAWAVLGFSAVTGVVAFAALGRLATIARRRAAVAPPVVATRPVRTRAVEAKEQAVLQPVATWTPVAVPKPLYLSRSEAPTVAVTITSADRLEELRQAALESDRALREAQESPEVTPITQPEPAAPPSRFASMGVLTVADSGTPDLDDVLRRRRQAV